MLIFTVEEALESSLSLPRMSLVIIAVLIAVLRVVLSTCSKKAEGLRQRQFFCFIRDWEHDYKKYSSAAIIINKNNYQQSSIIVL